MKYIVNQFLFIIFSIIYFCCLLMISIPILIISLFIITPIYWLFTSEIIYQSIMFRFMDFAGQVMDIVYKKLNK